LASALDGGTAGSCDLAGRRIEFEPDQLAAGGEPGGNAGGFLGLIGRVLVVAGSPVRADYVEKIIGKGDALAVQLDRVAVKPIVDQWDQPAGCDLAFAQGHDLRRLLLVVDKQTCTRESTVGGAGDAAEVFSHLVLFPIRSPLTFHSPLSLATTGGGAANNVVSASNADLNKVMTGFIAQSPGR
jgi:hypothetical protein